MKMISLTLGLMLGASLGARVKDQEPQESTETCYYKDAMFSDESITVKEDVYDDAHDGKQRVDIYTASADARESRPAVVLIHGGSFSGGNSTSSCTWPEDYEDPEGKNQVFLRECTGLPKLARKLAQLGYVVFSIEYALGLKDGHGMLGWMWSLLVMRKNNVAIEASKDARAAVRWIKTHANDLKVDPSKLAMMGDSAGAITTLWSNYRSKLWEEDKATKEETESVNSGVAAAISLSGTLSFKEIIPVAPDFTDSICCPRSQPPLLVIHSTGDKTIPYASGEKLYKRAHDVGLSATFIGIPDSWHCPYFELMDASPGQSVFYFDTFKHFLITSLKLNSECV